MNATSPNGSETSSLAHSPSPPSSSPPRPRSNGGGGGSQLSKSCRVCGDKALGYNFNVVTCESCKAFFRRNALKSKEFRCPFNDNCDVAVLSRRFCQKCRLKKCFQVGMKKEWIMSDEARNRKRQRIEENREKRKSSNNDATSSPSSPRKIIKYPAIPSVDSQVASFSPGQLHFSPQTPVQCQSSSKAHIIQQSSADVDCISIPKSVLINLLTSSSSPATQQQAVISSRVCICKCTCGALEPGTPIGGFGGRADSKTPSTPSNYFEDQARSNCQSTSSGGGGFPFHTLPNEMFDSNGGASFMGDDDSVYKVLNAAITSEFSDYYLMDNATPAEQEIGDDDGFSGLTEFEQHKLHELIDANTVMNEPIEKFVSENKNDNPTLTDVINLTDIAIRRIIKMSKRIECFKNLCQEDQIALLKGGCTELMILRGVMSYDPEKESWHGPHSHYIKLEVLKGIKGNVYEEHKRYLQSFNSSWRTNEPIMLILCAITLFTPDRPNVSQKEIIRNEQEMYYTMLKHFLSSNYGRVEAMKAYDQLVLNIDRLHRLNENAVSIFLNLNRKEVEPLLIEIFDLK